MIYPCRFFLLPAALLLTLSAPVKADELESFTARLAATAKGMKSLKAGFVQRKRLGLFKSEITSNGRILFQRPDQLRWETFAPDASVLLVTGKRAELRIPGERPRRIDLGRNRTVGILVEQLLVWLGARPATDLKRWYRVELKRKGDDTTLDLTPREPVLRKRFSRVEVVFGAELMIRIVRVHERRGDMTTIEFSTMERNVRLERDAFK